MGKILITLAIALPTFAILIKRGVIACPKFLGPDSSFCLARLLHHSSWQGVTNCARSGYDAGCRAFAHLVRKCKSMCLGICSAFSTWGRRLKSSQAKVSFNFTERIRRMRSKPPVPADSAGLAAVQSDPPGINCRIRLASDGKEGSACETFTVEICGEIHAPDDEKQMALNVIAFDVTDPESAPRPVYARGEQHSSGDSPVFCYDTDLGKLPGRDAVLSDWITVAQLEVDWLMFPRQGARNLRFRTSIVSRSSNRELACAECAFDYDNNHLGYIDLDENDARTRTLAVALAFAVSAADNKMYKCELDLIKNWARNNVSIERASTKARRKLEKAFDTTIAFFRGGNHLNTFEICREIVEIAPIADRYNILDLCLHVARAKGSVAPEELAILGDLAGSLEVDADVFRQMSEKVLPVNIHQSKDADMVLGVTPDMNSEKARQHLNEEYTKWNARVTNADPQIQAQADQMLALIAEARSQYVG